MTPHTTLTTCYLILLVSVRISPRWMSSSPPAFNGYHEASQHETIFFSPCTIDRKYTETVWEIASLDWSLRDKHSKPHPAGNRPKNPLTGLGFDLQKGSRWAGMDTHWAWRATGVLATEHQSPERDHSTSQNKCVCACGQLLSCVFLLFVRRWPLMPPVSIWTFGHFMPWLQGWPFTRCCKWLRHMKGHGNKAKWISGMLQVKFFALNPIWTLLV